MRFNNLNGRSERRLPIAVEVRLEVLQGESVEEHEQTYTDNLSAHGARVKSTHAWHPGELAGLSPLNEEFPVRAEVVYCQKRAPHSFFVGLKFPKGQVPWAIWKRFNNA